MDVKTVCLGILIRGEATGYEIKKQCEEGPFAHFQAAGFGSIYPALTALAAEGLVSASLQRQDKRPHRKVYRVTQKGRLAFLDALAEPPGPDRVRSDFLFIAFFSHLLTPRRLDALLDERLAWLDARIAELESAACAGGPPGADFTRGYGLAVYRAARDYVAGNRHALVGAALDASLR